MNGNKRIAAADASPLCCSFNINKILDSATMRNRSIELVRSHALSILVNFAIYSHISHIKKQKICSSMRDKKTVNTLKVQCVRLYFVVTCIVFNGCVSIHVTLSYLLFH